MKNYLERYFLCLLIGVTLVLLCSGCASEGVSKGAAVQSVGIGTVVAAGAATAVTFGWAAVLGFLTGLGRLLFAQSTTTDPPGGGDSSSVFPWKLVIWGAIILLVWLKGHRLLDLITGKGGRWNALLEIIATPLAKVKNAVQAKRAKA
jgi:hypothetical protein